MVKNTNQGWHRWTPSERANQNPLTSMWTTPNTSSGKFMQQPRVDREDACAARRGRDHGRADEVRLFKLAQVAGDGLPTLKLHEDSKPRPS